MKPYLRLVHPQPNVIPLPERDRLREQMKSKNDAAREISVLAKKCDEHTGAILKSLSIQLNSDVIDIYRRLRMSGVA